MNKSIRLRARAFVPALSVLSLAVSASAHAQSSELNSVVVTATRQAQRVSESIASVTVINREDIDQFGATSLGEVLSRGAGIEFSRQGSLGSAESVFIRGANGGHTLVLVDGVRIGSVSLGTTALEAIPLDQIQRIEVLRGPGSALYGSDAIGGVINVITKVSGDETTPTVGFSAGMGSQKTYVTHVSTTQKNGATSYTLNAGFSGSEGINSLLTPSNPGYNPDKDGYSNKNFGLNVEHAIDKNFVFGVGLLESKNKNRYDSYQYDGNYNPVNATLDYQRTHSVTEANFYTKFSPHEKWQSTLRVASGTDTDNQPSSTQGASDDRYKTTQRQYMWQNDIAMPIGQALLLVERVEQKLDSNQTYSLYERAVDSYAIGWHGRLGRHNFQVNSRQDRNSQYGSKNSEYLGYAYQATPAWSLATGYGTSFKAPTFNDLYYPDTPGVGRGNLNLKPENATSREVSLRYEEGHVQAHITHFESKIKNLIQWADDGTGNGTWTPSNISSATIKGEEVGVAIQNNAWKYKADLTYQQPKDEITGALLTSRARRYATLSTHYSTDQYKAGAELRLVGERYYDPSKPTIMGGYSLFNLFGEYKIDKEWKAFARVDNVFARNYELAHVSSSPSAIYGVPGRTAFLGLRYLFK